MLEGRPVLVVDYLFISREFRGKPLEGLNDLKAVEYIMSQIIKVAAQISHLTTLELVALQPDTERLEKYYLRRYGFEKIGPKNRPSQQWLILKV